VSPVLIGVDVGTTVLKVAAFDSANGKMLAHAFLPLKLHALSDGGREQSPVSLDRALTRAFRELRRQLGRRWCGIAGIGVAAQGGSTIIAERRTGRPLTPMILWNDTRAIEQMSMVKRRTSRAFWQRHTLRDDPGWGLARILWLKKHRPSLFSDRNIYVGAGEYVYFRLTGVWRQDAGNALQIGCYNAEKKSLDQKLFDIVGLPVTFVAPMRQGHELHPVSKPAANRLDLTAGIPVAGPYIDHEAGFLSAVGSSDRPLQCSLGTAWVGNFALRANVRWASPTQLVVPGVVGEGWLVMEPLRTGNVAWDWALEHLVDRNHDKALRKAGKIFADSLLPADGLSMIPYFGAPNPVRPSVVGGASFNGLSLRSNKDDCLRAVAASLAFEMARVFTELRRTKSIDSVILGGGSSKGEFFRRLLSSLFYPLPLLCVTEADLAGTRGSLHVFSPKVARAATRSVPPPPRALREDIAEGYEQYLVVLERFCGSYVKVPFLRVNN